jgi:hypothetical protein
MPKAGNVVIEKRSGSSSRQPLYERFASDSSVVQVWPAGVTNCRSSSQIGQFAGGLSVGLNCVPQVLHMKTGMRSPVLAAPLSVKERGARCWKGAYAGIGTSPTSFGTL